MPVVAKPLSLQGVNIPDPRKTYTLAEAVEAAVAREKALKQRREMTVSVPTAPTTTAARVAAPRPEPVPRSRVPRDLHSAQSLKRTDVLAGTVDCLPLRRASRGDAFRRPEGLGVTQRQLSTTHADAPGGLQRCSAILRQIGGLPASPPRRRKSTSERDGLRHTWARDPQSRRLDPGIVLLQTALRRRAPQSKNLEERLLAEGHRRLNTSPSRKPAPPQTIAPPQRWQGAARPLGITFGQ